MREPYILCLVGRLGADYGLRSTSADFSSNIRAPANRKNRILYKPSAEE
jgi:hypothetical protein